MSSDSTLDRYLEQARSWDFDRGKQLRRLARLAGWSAVAGWSLAMCLAAAVVVLTPLKTVEPFVVRVDNTTGLIDVVPVYAGHTAIDETVTRYLLTRYVRVCESYLPASAESDYEECGAFNGPERNQEWYATWNTSNPESPLNRYRDGTTVRARVKSVTFFKRASGGEDLAQVRYTTARRNGGTGAEQVAHFIATLQFGYAEPSRNPRTRQWNPLGLRVATFRREAEVAEADAAPVTASVKP